MLKPVMGLRVSVNVFRYLCTSRGVVFIDVGEVPKTAILTTLMVGYINRGRGLSRSFMFSWDFVI